MVNKYLIYFGSLQDHHQPVVRILLATNKPTKRSLDVKKVIVSGCLLFILFIFELLKGLCHGDFADVWPKLS